MNIFRPVKINQFRQSVVICGEKSKLSDEVVGQLGQYKSLLAEDVTGQVNRNSSPFNVSGIFYFIGFGPGSYSQTQLATSTLQEYLQFSSINKCPFFLILGSQVSHLTKTSALMATQFSSLYRTKLITIQISASDPDIKTAEEIIKKFIFNHRSPFPKSTVGVKSKIPPNKISTIQSKKKFMFRPKRVLSAFAILVGIILSFLTSLGILENVALKSFSEKDYLRSSKYSALVLQALPVMDLLRSLKINTFSSPENFQTFDDVNKLIINSDLFDSKNLTNLSSVLREFGRKLEMSALTNSHSPFEAKLVEETAKLEVNLTKLLISMPALNILSSGNLLITLHDSQSITPQGGRLIGVVIIGLDSGQIRNTLYYSSSQLEKMLPGELRSYPELEKVTGSSHMSLSDLFFDPEVKISGTNLINYVQSSTNTQVDAWIPISEDVYRGLICPQLISLKSACSGQLQSLFSTVFSSEKTSDVWKNLTTSDKNTLLLKFISLLGERRTLVFLKSSHQETLNAVGWGSDEALNNCTSWLICQRLEVSTSFYSFGPGVFLSPVKTSLYSTIQTGSSSISSLLTLTVPKFSAEKSKLMFWLIVPDNVQIETSKLDDDDLEPVISTSAQTAGKSKLGFVMENSNQSERKIQISLSQPLETKDRFRYQLSLFSPKFITDSTMASIEYPPQWTALIHISPSVATSGKLSYNASQHFIDTNTDFIPK